MPFTIDFKGKCIVVSGGNRGIGLALSQEIAAAGASVAILYHSSKDAPQQAENIAKQYGVKCKAWQCDVGNQELVKQTFKNIDKELGPITGLVANAGISVVKDALSYTSADFDKVYHTNVLGVFHTAQAAAQLWKDSGYKQGSIVIIASMSSQIFNLGINQCFYNSSKAAVAHVGKCLAVEWAPLSIRVNIVSPGYVETDQTSHMPKDLRDMQAGIVPLKRFAKPHEMAGQTVFLLSDHASYMTGAECFVDGGNLVV